MANLVHLNRIKISQVYFIVLNMEYLYWSFLKHRECAFYEIYFYIIQIFSENTLIENVEISLPKKNICSCIQIVFFKRSSMHKGLCLETC